MRRDDVRFAAAARDDGLRKISKYTWRAGAAGVVCSALLAVAFGHHVATPQPTATHNAGSSASSGSAGSGSAGSGSAGSGSSSAGSGSSSAGSGNGSAGGSGASGGSGGSNQGQGTIVVPAQPPAPASGGGQVTSGAS
jgi:hypothetical protein